MNQFSCCGNSRPANCGSKLFASCVVLFLFFLFFGRSAFAQTTLTPATLSFANQAVGSTSASKNATFKNIQTVQLTISSIAISGTDAADFAWVGGSCSPGALNAGKSCTVTVAFSPSVSGNRTASLTVTDSASTSPQSITLKGTGVAPITLLPGTLAFATEDEGVTSGAKTETLKNNQTVPLTINSIAISGTDAADYAPAGNCPLNPSTLGSGKSCSITVTFTPSALGSRTASLTVTDSASTSPQSIALTGTGVAPVTVSPSTLTFASLQVGTTSAAKTITLTNHLKTNLTVLAIMASGDFAVASNTCGSSVGAGLNCKIGVTFTPTAVGSRQATLTINDGAFGSPTTVALSGTGKSTGVPILVSIAVTPTNPSIAMGTTQQFTATGTYTDGSMQNLTSTATWSSSTPGVATINASGLASGSGTGQTTIEAASGAINGSTTLAVTAAAGFVLTGRLNTGRFRHTATLLNNGMALIVGGIDVSGDALASAELYNPATGTFTLTGSLNNARFWHTATLLNSGLALLAGGEGPTSFASAELYEPATLSPRNLVSIAVTPAMSTLSPGTTQQFLAAGTFSDSSTEQLASVTWSTSDTTLAEINNGAGTQGLSFAIAPGTVTITANAGSVSGSATLTVRPTGFVSTGSLNTAREDHTETLLNNGMVLVAGGFNGITLSSAELYNPATGTFTATGSLNVARLGHTATLLNDGTVLISGGATLAAELYDPATGTFVLTGSLNALRVWHTATLLNNGMVLIAGGLTPGDGGGSPIASAELYDPATKTFSYTGSMNNARYYDTATLLNNGQVLIAGGTNGSSYLSSAELYNSVTGTFTLTGSMNSAREAHAATLVSGGLVLVAGGINGITFLASAELYNPVTQSFAFTGSMNNARDSHTETLLNDGMVLVEGGTNSSGTVPSGELYNPSTGVFTASGSLNTPRTSQTATLLNSGMVLIVGGLGSSGILSSSELY